MKKLITIIMFFLCVSLNAKVAQESNITSVRALYPVIEELESRFSSEDILVVFDIDNTVLKTASPVPSDQWFEWQWDEISVNSQYSIASDHDSFLDHLETLYRAADFLVTEEEHTKNAVNRFFFRNSFFYLTSRNLDMLEVTESALNQNQIGMSFNRFKAQNLSTPTRFKEIASKSMLGAYSSARKDSLILYANNVFFTAGLNKGMMLRLMIEDTGLDPKAIIFLDDKAKHTKNVQQEFFHDEVEVYSFTYEQVLPEVHSFESLQAEDKHKLYLEFLNKSE